MRKHRHISLDNWSQTLRDYQVEAVRRAREVPQGGKLLLSAPTGTGKGTIQLGLLKSLRDEGKRAWIVTPSLEVLRGYLERCGARPVDLEGGSGKLARLGEKIFVTTPVRMRNMLRGRVLVRRGKRMRVTRSTPDVMIIDEAHHATLETVAGGGLRVLCPNTTFIGLTATPFRSTPDESGELLEAWGDAQHVLTIPQAIENGAWALPTWRCEPLINDDLASIVAGDLDADEITITAASSLAALIKSLDLNVPSCVTVSRVKVAKELCRELDAQSVSYRLVTGETPTAERGEIYEHCKKGGTILVSVRVLGEGVDLPWLRRWVDASPTLSPVAFLQKLGRITRPHASGAPEYVGTNRNLERFGWLLQGLMPRAVIREVQERFGGGSRRAAVRRAGLMKGAGKIKAVELPLAGGVTGTMFALWHPNKFGGSGFERCILIDPTSERVISAVRSINSQAVGKDRFGPWVREPKAPAKLNGFRAARMSGKVSGPQAAWWKREAANRGLDASILPTRAQFFALPTLVDCKAGMTETGLAFKERDEEAEKRQTLADAAQAGPAQLVLDGYYTVVDGEQHRTYRFETTDPRSNMRGKQIVSKLHGPENTSDYHGVGFGQGPTIHVWRNAQDQEVQIKADYAVIAGNADEAGKLFAMRSGRCWRCRRELTTPESAASGIGPECAEKLGVERVTRAQLLESHEQSRAALTTQPKRDVLATLKSFEASESVADILTSVVNFGLV